MISAVKTFNNVTTPAQPFVSSPRDMAIVVHFARLEPPGGEPNPGTHVARVREVGRRLDGSDIGGSDDGADAGGRHEPSAIRIVAHLTEQEPVELGGTVADGAPSFQKREDD